MIVYQKLAQHKKQQDGTIGDNDINSSMQK
jgi:hypothetical protein